MRFWCWTPRGERELAAATWVCSSDSSELFRLLQNSREPRIPTELPDPLERPAPRSAGVPQVDIEALPGMTGHSLSLRRVYRLARLVAPRQTTVLLTGETGTGKELVARALHALSPRRERPFVVINCAAIPEPLLEAELFGYNRGAFTGAFQSRVGRIQMAQGGTVLLDEVGDLPLSMQAKFLRFLQEGEVQRLGSSDTLRVDARVIAATNANLLGWSKKDASATTFITGWRCFPLRSILCVCAAKISRP